MWAKIEWDYEYTDQRGKQGRFCKEALEADTNINLLNILNKQKKIWDVKSKGNFEELT
jgi:hypothetical protein